MLVADIRVGLKKGVADPEGKNTRKALELLGFEAVAGVRTSRCFSVLLDTDSAGEARDMVERMCQMLLANPVINDYSYEIRGAEDA